MLSQRFLKNAKKIEEYIKSQLKEDEVNGQMTIFDDENPFTGSKNTKA